MNQSNATSLILYKFLIDDSQKELNYWQGEPESAARAENLKRFAELHTQHTDNYNRVMKQAQDNGDNLKEDITTVLNWLEEILKLTGGILGEEVKKYITALINIARKILELIK